MFSQTKCPRTLLPEYAHSIKKSCTPEFHAASEAPATALRAARSTIVCILARSGAAPQQCSLVSSISSAKSASPALSVFAHSVCSGDKMPFARPIFLTRFTTSRISSWTTSRFATGRCWVGYFAYCRSSICLAGFVERFRLTRWLSVVLALERDDGAEDK